MYDNCKKISLPTYEFRKTKYWIEGKKKINLNNIFYKKEKVKKEIIDNLDNDNNDDLIIIYNSEQKEFVQRIQANNHIIFVENSEYKSQLEKIDKNKKYKVLLLLEHFDFIENNAIKIEIIVKKTLQLIDTINYLVNSGIVKNLYFVDIQKENNIQNIITRKIYISLLQVAELENRSINFYKLLFNGETDI